MLQRVDGQLGRHIGRRPSIQLVEQSLDVRVVSGRRPRDDLTGARACRKAGIWKSGGQQANGVDRRRGGCALQVVDRHRRPTATVGLHFLDGLGDHRRVGLRPPSEELSRRGICGEFHVWQQFLQHLDRRRRIDTLHGIGFEFLLVIGGLTGAYLLECRSDLLVLVTTRPDHHASRPLVHDELGVGKQLCQEQRHAGRIGDGKRVDDQPQLLCFRHILLHLFQHLGDFQVFRGLGPNGQLAGLAFANDLDRRHVCRQ